jgi:Prolyl oligopeptidase family.
MAEMSIKKSTAVKIAAGTIAAGAACGHIAGRHFYNMAIDAESTYKPDLGNHHRRDENESAEGYRSTADLLAALGGEDIWELSNDGKALKLHALKIINNTENASGMWVIAFHGHASDCSMMGQFADVFYNMGFNILLPDARGCGRSEGYYHGMGWDDRLDCLAWIDRISRDFDDPSIVLFGVSMGASTVMLAEGEKLPDNVKAAIEDCGYTSIRDQLTYSIGHIFHIPAFPVLQLTSAVTKRRAGYSLLHDGSCVDAVRRSATPTLFIHGDSDTFIPPANMEKLFSAAACPKEKLTIHGAGHGQSAMTDPDMYWSAIYKFLWKYTGGTVHSYQ